MKKILKLFITSLLFFCIGCGNSLLLRESVKKKTMRNFVLAQIQNVSSEKIDVLILQSWTSKILIKRVNDDEIIIGDYVKKDVEIKFSLENYLKSQQEYCNYCSEQLSIAEITLDKLSKGLLDKKSRKRLESLKKGDLVIIALNKRELFYPSGLFQFNRFNYIFLEKRYNSCLRSDFSRLY